MSAARNLLLSRGRQRALELRAATLTYDGYPIPCTMGNLDFFEELAAGGGGFTAFKNIHVTILRSHIPDGLTFKRGEPITLLDDDTQESVELTIGGNNSKQAAIIILNLQANQA